MEIKLSAEETALVAAIARDAGVSAEVMAWRLLWAGVRSWRPYADIAGLLWERETGWPTDEAGYTVSDASRRVQQPPDDH